MLQGNLWGHSFSSGGSYEVGNCVYKKYLNSIDYLHPLLLIQFGYCIPYLLKAIIPIRWVHVYCRK